MFQWQQKRYGLVCLELYAVNKIYFKFIIILVFYHNLFCYITCIKLNISLV